MMLAGLIPTDGRERQDLLAAMMDTPGDLAARRCKTTTGTRLHPLDVIKAAIDGRVRRVVIDSASVTNDLGRTNRLFTLH